MMNCLSERRAIKYQFWKVIVEKNEGNKVPSDEWSN